MKEKYSFIKTVFGILVLNRLRHLRNYEVRHGMGYTKKSKKDGLVEGNKQ